MQDIKQQLTLIDRRTLTVGGIIEIIGYDDENITLYSVMGDIRIKGEQLEVNSAFSEKDIVVINGFIRSISFSDNKEKYADNFISRIFR
ncbi:MAG: YabP/YqfC family sporulation protein [Ruminiclostridium sp.]